MPVKVTTSHPYSLSHHPYLVSCQVLLNVPPNNFKNVSLFFFLCRPWWLFFLPWFLSYLVTLLWVCSPPTILNFLKCRWIVSFSYGNSFSEFSLSWLFSYCTPWNHVRDYCGGGGCSQREEEQVRPWAAVIPYILWHPNESLLKRKKKV